MRRRLHRCIPWLAFDLGRPPTFLYTSGRLSRCNPPGVSCLYFSEQEATADAEFRFAWAGAPGRFQPKLSFTAVVSFRHVLDLADEAVVLAAGLSEADLFGSWRLSVTPTRLQQLGEVVSRQSRIAAIRYPSQASRRLGLAGWNVAIFPSALRPPDRVEILGDSAMPLAVIP
ncbi:MAG TPA: RES family NAD+ phosphorylase [Thermoanaerobaculia bacterium]|nr:RES family NAD+ phosphorylase [Thermoanaerobaculia bacterium]